jgi:hypothetical protein
MENMQYYDAGLKFIDNVARCRMKINSINDKITRAEHFLGMKPDSEMWKQLLKEDQQELITYQNEEKVQTEALKALESKMDQDFFMLLMQNLGNVIARTMPIPHVENNLHDENELHDAITATVEAIKIKRYEYDSLLFSEANEKEIVASELRYFYNDLALHPWGKQRLADLDVPESYIQQPATQEAPTERGRA